ncbi:MAG: dienelactone hydrolase family protein [Opitutaceae bacterium]|nr:dienelactone hydrolase family protein [Opitutaceae bacterium]
MPRSLFTALIALVIVASSQAQVRVTPKAAKGGITYGEPWANVPAAFRESIRFPTWPVPTDLAAWQSRERARTRATLLSLLGEMPPRPQPLPATVKGREERGDYAVERIEFFNGVDMQVPGIVLVPKNARRAPAIIVMHTWSGTKEDLLLNAHNFEHVGTQLVRQGYVVAAIDGYFHGERLGKGPNDTTDPKVTPSQIKQRQQQSLYGLNVWLGRTLWGMMVRDQQCLLDYLQSRSDVDPEKIGATGMSLGNTTGWWLAAIDERVKAVVGVACFTRIEQLVQHGQVQAHGLYYFVPNMLKHFDTEAVFAVVAPRPMLQLNGDGDSTCPPDGIEVLEQKIGAVYRLHGQPDNFRSVIYLRTGHEYLPEMKAEMVQWFLRHLPPKR